MKDNHLDHLFNPRCIAVIGASNRKSSVGKKVFSNILNGNYLGKLYPVNPKHKKVQGRICVPSVNDISDEVDLAIITTPRSTILQIIKECAEKKIHAAIIISAGFSEKGSEGKLLEKSILELAHQHNIRIIGPNCLGVMRPHLNLNATFDNSNVDAGPVALISQSGAICAAILDWAVTRKIGFSSVISIGNAMDLDFGEILEFLANDPKTESILLYIEGIHDAAKFMHGLHSAARIKPVVVIKAGRNSQGSRAAHSHTGALVGSDAVFDVALHRCGTVRVKTIKQLFAATEVLSSGYQTQGNRLAIITNGGGAGVMAADKVAELNIQLAELNENSLSKLNDVLPSSWSHQNPIDIIGDAPPERYHAALNVCLKDDNIDAILVMLVPVSMTNPYQVAKQLIVDAKTNGKPILACWMGDKQVKSSWQLFAKSYVSCFQTPEEAVEAFSYIADYHHNKELLLQTPKAYLLTPRPNIADARKKVESALATSKKILTSIETKQILKDFYIPVNEIIEASTADSAVKAANKLGFPVVMKINSPDISHKKDAGGVMLNLNGNAEIKNAFERIISNAKQFMPDANILGVTVEAMFKSDNDRELMIGVARDKVFGPVISFGAGGTYVEIMKDNALGLPPLNAFLAEKMITKTKIYKALGKFRNMPPVDLDILVNTLLRVSEMVCHLPEMIEMDINPFTINEKGAVALDARMVIAQTSASALPYGHMVIRPEDE
ncbi:MAG: acetate--CoA ligase family protein [Gammaproteobacteria bacterium]